MGTHKTIIGFILCVSLFVGLAGCGASIYGGDNAPPRFLRNNIHAQDQKDELRASYANWTDPGERHVIIPVNTPVKVLIVRRDLTFVTQDTNKTIYFEFDEGRMGMTNEQYVTLVTSTQPANLASLSAVDRKGISEGKAHTGMTKEGIRIALGYPAVHKTPSLDSNTWYYWTNRWKPFAIEFGKNGTVSKIIR
jgi:hypothetical protein